MPGDGSFSERVLRLAEKVDETAWSKAAIVKTVSEELLFWKPKTIRLKTNPKVVRQKWREHWTQEGARPDERGRLESYSE